MVISYILSLWFFFSCEHARSTEWGSPDVNTFLYIIQEASVFSTFTHNSLSRKASSHRIDLQQINMTAILSNVASTIFNLVQSSYEYLTYVCSYLHLHTLMLSLVLLVMEKSLYLNTTRCFAIRVRSFYIDQQRRLFPSRYLEPNHYQRNVVFTCKSEGSEPVYCK